MIVPHRARLPKKTKIKIKDTQFFNNYNTKILICLYGYTLYRLMVTIVDGGPAYEGEEQKTERTKKLCGTIAQISNPAC
jgi:hypothetical protein